jgi:TPR repeat protein
MKTYSKRIVQSRGSVHAIRFLFLTLLVWFELEANSGGPTPGQSDAATKIRVRWQQTSLDELLRLADQGNAEVAYVFALREMEAGRAAVNAAFEHIRAAEPTGPVYNKEEVLARWKGVARDKLLEEVAKQNREAQYYYGHISSNEGVARTKKGFEWLKQAAVRGVVPAQFDTGMFYARRMGYVVVDLDNREAAKWFQKAADQGHEESTHQLAELYWEGGLGWPDFAQTVTLLQRCVDLGCHRAEYQLAMLYASGVGEPRHDGERPGVLLEKARAAEVPLAYLELAQRYRSGFGVSKNLVRSARYYVLITRFDNAGWKLQQRVEEVFNSLLTPEGKPKPNSDPETYRFAEYLAVQARAVQDRDPKAIVQMVEWEMGNGDDERTRNFAYYWLSLAQHNGLPAAVVMRDRVEKTMTAAELEKAKADIAATLARNKRKE